MVIDFDDIQEVEISPLEYVIHLGAHGNHILFDNDQIRQAFAGNEADLAELGSDKAVQVREAVRKIITIPDFEDKKEFISSLPKDVQEMLIFLYFQMIEKTVHLNQKRYH